MGVGGLPLPCGGLVAGTNRDEKWGTALRPHLLMSLSLSLSSTLLLLLLLVLSLSARSVHLWALLSSCLTFPCSRPINSISLKSLTMSSDRTTVPFQHTHPHPVMPGSKDLSSKSHFLQTSLSLFLFELVRPILGYKGSGFFVFLHLHPFSSEVRILWLHWKWL